MKYPKLPYSKIPLDIFDRAKEKTKDPKVKAIIELLKEGETHYEAAMYLNEIGKQLMDRICVCGHECRNHEFAKLESGGRIPDRCKQDGCLCILFKYDKSTNKIVLPEDK